MKIFGGLFAFVSGSLFGHGAIYVATYPIGVSSTELMICGLIFGAAFTFGYVAAIECISNSRK